MLVDQLSKHNSKLSLLSLNFTPCSAKCDVRPSLLCRLGVRADSLVLVLQNTQHLIGVGVDRHLGGGELSAVLSRIVWGNIHNALCKFKYTVNKCQNWRITNINRTFDIKKLSFFCIIIYLQESWLPKHSDLYQFDIDDYMLISQGKLCCGHGGLTIYLRNN